MVESLPIGGKSLTQDYGGTCKDRKEACEECAIIVQVYHNTNNNYYKT